MAYLVLARKYRPQQFGEMSGQAHVVRTLSNALKTGQLAHAFLFTGPRGVGKTTTARLVAKALNCEKGPTPTPCGVCTPCTEIAEGRAVDVVEIDAASNNGVDNVRDIVEAVKYRPARDRYKVFVVDEVHMLSTGAFNALLKTLEEPPEHVKFVLATTDVHKVPETIVSRCQRFDFRRLTLQQIADQLGKVAQAEGMSLSPAALALVARQAEGGMRDALSMLDQVRAACGDAPGDEAVAEALGAVDASAISRIGGALVARDGAALLAEIDQLHGRGLEMKRVAEEIVRHLRNVVVARLVPGMALDLPDAELAEVKAQAAAADAAQLTRLFDLAQRAVVEVKLAEGSRHALEVALLEGVFLAPGAQVSELIARVEALAKGAPVPPAAPRTPPSSPAPGGGGGGARKSGLASFGSPGCAAGPAPPEPASVRPERSEDAPASERSRRAAPPAPPTDARALPPSPRPSPPAAAGGEGVSSPPPELTSVRSERGEAPAAPELASVRPERSEDASASERSRRAAPAPEPARTFASDAERWRAAVEEVEKVSPMAAPALKQAVLVAMGAGEVAIQLPPGLFAQAVERRRAEIEAALGRFLGQPTRLAVTIGAPAAAPEAAAPAPSIAQLEAAERQARSAHVREAARANPNIREAARILEGGLEKIEEL